MRVTPRLAILFAFGAVPLVLVGWFPVLGVVVFIYDLVLAACFAADVLATRRPEEALQFERVVNDKLSLGAENAVTVRARNRSPLDLRVVVRDEPPERFTVTGETQRTLELPRDSRAISFEYFVSPHAKGDYAFGDIYVRYKGFLGLSERVGKFVVPGPVKVYPNLMETAKYELLARRGRLMQVGIRVARLRGGGSEFESLRDYVPGDEYKKIDWNATARRDRLIVRQYQAERSQNIVLLIDTGRSMLQQIAKMSKLDYVVNTALMLAYVAAASDDKVGLMAFDAEVRTFLPPAKSKGQVYKILESLYNVNAQMVETDYRAAFQELATRWRRRSLVVLFSDLIDPDSSAQILDAAPMIAALHRVVCVTVSDPNIVTAAEAIPVTAAEVYTKAVAQQVLQERRQAINILRRRGVWTIDSLPEALSADLINHYLDLKARSMI